MKNTSLIKSGLLVIVLSTMLSSLVYADRGSQRERSSARQPERGKRLDSHFARDQKYQRINTKSKDYRRDTRYRLDRSYPRPGYHIDRLPVWRPPIHYRNTDYYFHGGVWYRPSGSRFVVVTPAIGIVVPTLPPFYATIWVSGIPYYYANDVYYAWRPDRNGYVVTAPPQNVNQPEPPLIADELFIYPMNGQNEQQQADDRYACHRWSVSQTNYDPSLSPENISTKSLNRKREDYQRAMRACLEGKGYSVR